MDRRSWLKGLAGVGAVVAVPKLACSADGLTPRAFKDMLTEEAQKRVEWLSPHARVWNFSGFIPGYNTSVIVARWGGLWTPAPYQTRDVEGVRFFTTQVGGEAVVEYTPGDVFDIESSKVLFMETFDNPEGRAEISRAVGEAYSRLLKKLKEC